MTFTVLIDDESVEVRGLAGAYAGRRAVLTWAAYWGATGHVAATDRAAWDRAHLALLELAPPAPMPTRPAA